MSKRNFNKSSELRYLLAAIKRASLDDRTLLTFPKTNFQYKVILKMLQDEGFIQSFQERGDYLLIQLRQTYWKTFGRPTKALIDIKPIMRMRNSSTISARDLKHKQFLEGNQILYLVTTDQGILSGNSAAKQYIGGLPLVKVL
jgi:ribosomal protein S8